MDPREYFQHYANKYSLEPDPILTIGELTKFGQIVANVQTGLPPTIEEWQSLIGDVLLTSKVPEDIARTFYVAKRLFVFSYFEYLFSTVSAHYSFLAVEAGLQARWAATLPNPCPVSHRNGVTNEIHNPSYAGLLERFHADRRLPGDKNFVVNGERFPSTMQTLVAALEKMRIINADDEKMILAVLDLRNDYSHREFSTVSPADTAALSIAAGLLNKLFDSV